MPFELWFVSLCVPCTINRFVIRFLLGNCFLRNYDGTKIDEWNARVKKVSANSRTEPLIQFSLVARLFENAAGRGKGGGKKKERNGKNCFNPASLVFSPGKRVFSSANDNARPRFFCWNIDSRLGNSSRYLDQWHFRAFQKVPIFFSASSSPFSSVWKNDPNRKYV